MHKNIHVAAYDGFSYFNHTNDTGTASNVKLKQCCWTFIILMSTWKQAWFPYRREDKEKKTFQFLCLNSLNGSSTKKISEAVAGADQLQH